MFREMIFQRSRKEPLDFYEFQKKRYPELGDNLPSLREIGLKEDQPSLAKIDGVNNGVNNKAMLISRHPTWRGVLENPNTEIPLLIQKREFSKLRKIWPTLITQGDKNVIRRLTPQFEQPHSADWKAELRSLIDRGDEKVFEDLAMSAFSKPHAVGWDKELQTVIDRGDKATLQRLAMFAFSEPHSSEWKGQLHSLIDRADQVTLQRLGMYAFSKPHSVAWREELRRIIARADRKTLQALETQVFSQPHALNWKQERDFVSSRLK